MGGAHGHSSSCPARSACVDQIPVDRGCMIFAIALAVNTLLRWYQDGVDVERRLPELSTYLGHAHITDTYWYLTATPELLQQAHVCGSNKRSRPDSHHEAPPAHSPLCWKRTSSIVSSAATSQLVIPSRAIGTPSACCVDYAQRQLGKAPSDLTLDGPGRAFLGAFLDHLENERGNSARSRNVRLAAIHSFFRYVALHSPEHSALAQRVLAMPSKRYLRRPIDFSTSREVAALLAAPDLDKWIGRRDRALLLLAVQTGLRASELVGLRCEDITLGPAAFVQCLGKGRKLRNTPLRKDTVAVLRSLVGGSGMANRRIPRSRPSSGSRLSHDAIPISAQQARRARSRRCPSLAGKRRHSTCTATYPRHGPAPPRRRPLRHRPLARATNSDETTAIYLQADMKLKEQALAKTDVSRHAGRADTSPTTGCSAFLKSL